MLTIDLLPYQDPAVDRVIERGSALLAYDMGLGKEQPISEPVLTPHGWTTMGQLKPGDHVIGKDGRPTEVLGVYPQGTKPVFRVTFSDGSTTRAGADHLWEVRTGDDFRRGTRRVMTTSEILASGLRDGAGNRKYRIPVVEPVQFEPTTPLPLDPYLLGVLLGDGGIKCTELGLKGHGVGSKYIPEPYLYARVEDRVLLLQGLLDTDGHVGNGNNVEYTTVSRRLAADVVALVRSLGGVARIRETQTTHRLAYRMSICLPDTVSPFRLPRKASVYRPVKYLPTRLLDSIELVGEEESVCIKVAAEDSLYVTNDYVVTHNTITSLAIAEELLGRGEISRTLIVCPSGLKWQWAQTIAARTDVATQTIQIKGEYMEVPEDRYCVVVDGPAKRRNAQYAQIREIGPEYVIVGYTTVSSDLRAVKGIQPGLIIADEMTAVKNPRAEVTKSFRQLKAPYRVGLTGTPVDKELEDLYHLMWWIDPGVLGRFDLFDKCYIERDIWGNVKRYKNTDLLRRTVADVLIRKRTTDADVAEWMPRVEHRPWFVKMDDRTRSVYREIAADLAHELSQLPARSSFDLYAHYSGVDESTPAGRVMAVHIAAQMLLTEPDLLVDSDSAYAKSLVDRGVIDGLQRSAKWFKLVSEVDALLAEGRKIILVTRWRGMVERLRERWPEISVAYRGGMTPVERQAAVNRFESDPEIRILVMSHAGGYGVDLPSASVLINIDPARSTGQRQQINARHVRAGSRNEVVYVRDLITEGTIEERDYVRLAVRGRMASAVVDGKGADRNGLVENDIQSLTAHVNEVLSGCDALSGT